MFDRSNNNIGGCHKPGWSQILSPLEHRDGSQIMNKIQLDLNKSGSGRDNPVTTSTMADDGPYHLQSQNQALKNQLAILEERLSMCMEQLEEREHNKSQMNRSTIASGNRSTIVSAEQQRELQQVREENKVL